MVARDCVVIFTGYVFILVGWLIGWYVCLSVRPSARLSVCVCVSVCFMNRFHEISMIGRTRYKEQSKRFGGCYVKPLGQDFYPRPVLAFGYCRCLRLCVCVCVCLSVCLCVNHLLVRTITRDLFKLGSPNLDQRCKRPWLRSLLFWGAIDLDLQGQI